MICELFWAYIAIQVIGLITELFSDSQYDPISEEMHCQKCDTITKKSGYSNTICTKCIRGV